MTSKPESDAVAPALRIEPDALAGSALSEDYIAWRGGAKTLFPSSPFDLDGFRHKLAEVSGRFGREERERAARALTPTSPRAAERLQRFVDEGGAMITTGQQVGLLTGPMYTVFKAATAARLAEALEAELGVLIIPVFWAASEDHDWAEVNHADLPVAGGGVRRLELDASPDAPHPMSEIRLANGLNDILGELSEVFAGLGYADDCLEWIEDSYRPGKSVAEGFVRLVSRVLAPLDLCVTSASDPALKAASAMVLEKAIRDAQRHEQLLAESSARVEAAGYSAQVAVLEGATNLFVHQPTGRFRIYRDAEDFRLPDTGQRIQRDQLLARVREDPVSVSPNVFLRPVVESHLFPSLAYVAGPGEIAYFAQLRALFPEFGMAAPVVYPRVSLTLVEPAHQRLLEKLEMERGELAAPHHELVERLARRAMPDSVQQAIDRLNRSVNDGYQELIAAAASVDPTLEDALASLRNQTLARVGDSERKVVRQLKRREEVMAGQLERLRANLRPDGGPQDRVLNILPFLARHGPGLIGEIAAAIQIELR